MACIDMASGMLDADRDGRLTGSDAVKFFERSGLPRAQLAKVWALADNGRRGYLDVYTFSYVGFVTSVACKALQS